jgi:predicted amidohydrolase
VKESGTTTVAAVQLSSGADVQSNVDGATQLIHEAAERGATYIQLPEYFNYLGAATRYPEVAEAVPGPTTLRLSEIASSRHVTIHVGSMLERSADSTRCFNTSVIIGPTGEVVARYRKIHLFDVDVPGAVVLRESDDIDPGEQMVVADVDGFRLGLSVCFDLRFPELYRALAVNGATILAIPSAFNAMTGSAHWEVLVRARAIENHAYVVAAAQAGLTGEGIATHGHSMVVGPWGDVLVESQKSGPDVLVASIDLAEVQRRRSQIAVLDLRRPYLYGRAVASAKSDAVRD